MAQAKKWLRDHDVKWILFEPAEGGATYAPRVVDAGDGTRDVYVFGGIGGFGSVDGEEVAQEIRIIDEDENVNEIRVHINSPGGSVVDGFSAISAILNAQTRVVTINEGIAASMGGIILSVGDEIRMFDFATMMIHEPSFGDETIEKTEDEKIKRGLIAIRDSLVKILQNRSGKTKAELNKIMNEETWYNANQAKAEGFVDKIISTKKEQK